MTDLHHHDDHHHEHDPGSGFEREDLGSKPVFGFMISLIIFGVLTYYVFWGMFRLLDAYSRKQENVPSAMAPVQGDTRTVTSEHVQETFPEPRLEDNERTELSPFRYTEEEQLNSYGWVDQNAGVVHIPIDRAMELIAQRGLSTTPQAGSVPASPVNLSEQAAAKADTSAAPKAGKKQGKRKSQ